MKAPMICDIHRQEIKYFCTAQQCYYLPLCDICTDQHRSSHPKLELVSIKKAFSLAQSNLQRNESQIEKYLGPLRTRQNMLRVIDQQKEELEREKRRLIQMITDKIDSQIRMLETSNQEGLNRDQLNIRTQLESKLQEIYGLKPPHFEGKMSLLRKALNLDNQNFMEQIKARYHHTLKSQKKLVHNRKYKVFHSTHHQIMISPLEMRERAHEKTRQIKRTMNQSPLYFIIDQNANNSNHIFSISPQYRKMFMYNIQFDDWTTFNIPFDVSRQAAAVHDHKRNRFFWIGGVMSGSHDQWQKLDNREHSITFGQSRSQHMRNANNERSNMILVYEPENRQRQWRYLDTKLNVPRSSCHAVLVQDKTDPNNYGIVIAGGLGPNGEVLKTAQFLDLQQESITMLQQTNFGAFAGTLVSYNKTNVLRIGGLYKNKMDVAVVEVVERLDLSQWIRSRDKPPRWSYVQLLVPQFERNQKLALFHANQAAIQINPNQIFVFGGINSNLQGSPDSFIIGVEQFDVQTRGLAMGIFNLVNKSGIKQQKLVKQYKFTVRWANEKPLISGDDFSGQCPSLWKGKLHILQNTGSDDMLNFQKRLLSFDMHEWSEIQDVLPQ